MRELHSMGIDCLIFMQVANDDKAFYPSSFMPKAFPEGQEGPVDAVMSEASELGMKVFLSTGWAHSQDDNLQIPEVKARQMQIMDEIGGIYKDNPAFYGWYLPVEDCLIPIFPEYAVQAVNSLVEHAHEITPGRKTLISPYGIFASDFENPRFEEQILKLKEHWKLLRAIHDKAGIEMWANCESFTWEKETNSLCFHPVPGAAMKHGG